MRSVTAGQNTTFFLVTPNEKYSDLPRHPVELDTPDECMVCRKDHGDPLACDKVLLSRLSPLPFLPTPPLVVVLMSWRSAISLITIHASRRPWRPSQTASGSVRTACVIQVRPSAT